MRSLFAPNILKVPNDAPWHGGLLIDGTGHLVGPFKPGSCWKVVLAYLVVSFLSSIFLVLFLELFLRDT